MNVFALLTLSGMGLAPPPEPAKNVARSFCIRPDQLDLYYLQRLIDVEIQKHVHGFTDGFCSPPFGLRELMSLDALLPREPELILLTGIELGYLRAYADQRYLMVQRTGVSLLKDVDAQSLLVALRDLRHLLHYQVTALKPVNLLRSDDSSY